jgi:transcriptional regulator with XRE-family HTH domain
MLARRLLIAARNRAGLAQRELAARSGIAQPVVSRIERGVADARTSTLVRLLRACDFDLEIVPLAGTGVDRTAIRELLRLTPAERLERSAEEAANLEALVPRPRR